MRHTDALDEFTTRTMQQATPKSFGLTYNPPSLTLLYQINGTLRKRTMPIRHLSQDSDPAAMAKRLSDDNPLLLAPSIVSAQQLRSLIAKLVDNLGSQAPGPSMAPLPASPTIVSRASPGRAPLKVPPAALPTSERSASWQPPGGWLPRSAAAAPTDEAVAASAALPPLQDNLRRDRALDPVTTAAAPKAAAHAADAATAPPPCGASSDVGDLNRVSADDLAAHKATMERTFQANAVKPGDLSYVHDKRVDFSAGIKSKNEWDDDIDDWTSEEDGM